MAKCKYCPQEVIWGVTEAGKKMIMQAKKTNVLFQLPTGKWKLYTQGHEPHWPHCVGKDQARKDKDAKGE